MANDERDDTLKQQHIRAAFESQLFRHRRDTLATSNVWEPTYRVAMVYKYPVTGPEGNGVWLLFDHGYKAPTTEKFARWFNERGDVLPPPPLDDPTISALLLKFGVR